MINREYYTLSLILSQRKAGSKMKAISIRKLSRIVRLSISWIGCIWLS